MSYARTLRSVAVICFLCLSVSSALAQKKKAPPKKEPAETSQTELAKLRDQYINATKEYKASLEKLLALYQNSLRKAEQHRDQMQKLLAEGLISKRDLEQAERDRKSVV